METKNKLEKKLLGSLMMFAAAYDWKMLDVSEWLILSSWKAALLENVVDGIVMELKIPTVILWKNDLNGNIGGTEKVVVSSWAEIVWHFHGKKKNLNNKKKTIITRVWHELFMPKVLTSSYLHFSLCFLER